MAHFAADFSRKKARQICGRCGEIPPKTPIFSALSNSRGFCAALPPILDARFSYLILVKKELGSRPLGNRADYAPIGRRGIPSYEIEDWFLRDTALGLATEERQEKHS